MLFYSFARAIFFSCSDVTLRLIWLLFFSFCFDAFCTNQVTSRYAGESEATLRRAFRAASNGDRSFSVGGSASGHSTAPADSNIGGSSASDSSSSSGGGGRILFIDEIDALAPATASNASEVCTCVGFNGIFIGKSLLHLVTM